MIYILIRIKFPYESQSCKMIFYGSHSLDVSRERELMVNKPAKVVRTCPWSRHRERDNSWKEKG